MTMGMFVTVCLALRIHYTKDQECFLLAELGLSWILWDHTVWFPEWIVFLPVEEIGLLTAKGSLAPDFLLHKGKEKKYCGRSGNVLSMTKVALTNMMLCFWYSTSFNFISNVCKQLYLSNNFHTSKGKKMASPISMFQAFNASPIFLTN